MGKGRGGGSGVWGHERDKRGQERGGKIRGDRLSLTAPATVKEVSRKQRRQWLVHRKNLLGAQLMPSMP